MLKKVVGILLFSYLTAAVLGCAPEQPAAEEEPKLDSQKSRISYTIGLNIGNDFAKQDLDIDPDLLLLGIRDALDEKEPRLSEEEMVAEIQAFQKQLQEQQMAKIQKLAEENQVASEAFLKENAEKEGVVVLDSGLQYKVVEAGEGDSPQADSVVTVHYRGTLVDGTEFDSSYSRNQPATFPVNGVIPGWSEALPLMKEGAKWELYIPADLAYGESGAGEKIGPNAALIFEVELLAIEEEDQAK